MRKRKLKMLLNTAHITMDEIHHEREINIVRLRQAQEELAAARRINNIAATKIDQLERDVLAAKATSVGVQAKVQVRYRDPSNYVTEYPVLAVQSIHGETCIWIGVPAR